MGRWIAFGFLLLLAAPMWGVTPGTAAEVTRFSDYPASETFTGTPPKIDTSKFEGTQPWVHDHIRATVARGPNFAGAYALVWVPCGTSCIAVFAVRLADKKIIWLPTLPAGVSHEKDSRLLIVQEYLGGEDFEDHYYVLGKDGFRRILSK